MSTIDGYLIAFMTFCLGVVSAAYGVQIGKSFEARKETLEKMREWVDEILLQLNCLYRDEIREKRTPVDWEQNHLSLQIHRIRWKGIVKGIHSSRLSLAMEDFILAVQEFNKRYDVVDKTLVDQSRRKNDLLSLIGVAESKAETLHDAITRESIQIPFWLQLQYLKPKSNAKWIITVLMCIILLLVAAGLFYKIF
jgi:hypothetical protein